MNPRDDNYNLYIIYSKQSIPDILNCLYSYTSSENPIDQLGPIRKDFTRDSKTRKYIESNRKLTLIKKSLFNILEENGLGKNNSYDFLISEYDIREDNYPPKDSVAQLFFPLKKGDMKVSPIVMIIEKMKYLEKMGIINTEQYKIKNNGIITFTDEINIITRIHIKIILDDVEDGFRISWCKKKYFYNIRDTRVDK